MVNLMTSIVLTDIDHTVFDSYWRDWMVVEETALNWDAYNAASVYDKPIVATVAILNALVREGWHAVGVTARPEKWRNVTTKSLMTHDVPIQELLMRPDDEPHKPSPALKLALVEKRFGPDFRHVIKVLLEDREDVTAAFKAVGIPVLQVHLPRWR